MSISTYGHLSIKNVIRMIGELNLSVKSHQPIENLYSEYILIKPLKFIDEESKQLVKVNVEEIEIINKNTCDNTLGIKMFVSYESIGVSEQEAFITEQIKSMNLLCIETYNNYFVLDIIDSMLEW
ncbi:hypothetical protein [Bacillus sp. SM2101]|uniref:hypothetical protein n=1 Tax=Bacillus sp. SM2101 TaxID=2805366 RepID=UPI001BDE5639|nr:hypothetical protein [Bacillus sp. SM2101]